MTEAEFIAAFYRNCDDGSVFAPTAKMIAEGADCAFSIELADGQPMLRGLGVVLAAWPTADNRFAAPGVHIEIAQLTTGTQPIHERLLEARASAEGRSVARTRPKPITQLRFAMTAEDVERPDDFEDESIVREVRRTITQEMQAASPGAPVEMIDERASQTIRYEGPLRAPAAIPEAPRAQPVAKTRVTPPRLPALPPPRRPITKSPPLAAQPAVPAPATTLPTAPMFSVVPVEPAALPEPPTNPGPPAFADPPTTPEAPAFARGTPMPPEAAPAIEAEAPQPAAPRARRLLALWTAIAARLRPITARLAPAASRVAARLAPLQARLARWLRPAWTWLAARARRLFAPTTAGAAPWWRNARVAAVFASGIVVGVLATLWARPGREARSTPIASAAPVQCEPAPAIARPAPAPPPTATVAAATPPAAAPKPAAKPRPATPKPPPAARPPTPPAPAKVAVAVKPPPPAKPPSATKPATPPPQVAATRPAPTTKPTKKSKCTTLDCI